MIDPNSGDKQRRKPSGSRRARDTFVTKSGQTIKVHRNISERIKASRDARERKRAARLAGMPKTPIKRLFYRLHPKRMYKYWFSREGGIMALKITGIAIIAGFLLLVGVFAYFRKDLPNLKDISGKNIGGSIRYYDKTNSVLLWEDYDAVKRIPVKEDDISQYMRDATIAVEDKDFFKHGGFDMRGIARAGLNDVVGGGPQQGGSTITQQLVKLNNNWTNDKTYIRKIKEVILAVELERSYTKPEILNGYLNTAPYGNVQYGVEAASRDYFGKSAKDLTLDESAFLAALPKSPSQYSPYGVYYKANPDYWSKASKNRQAYILDIMVEQRLITKDQADAAKKIDTYAKIQTPKPKFSGIKAPYFVLTAKEQLETTWGADQVKRGGWRVTTTLDMNVQKIAEEQVAKNANVVKRYGADEIGFAAEDVKTGQMVALVGGTDFTNDVYGQNNYARLKIPPGSSIKPYDYAALFENTTNFGAGSVLYDSKGPIPGYPCTTGVTPTGNCAHDYNFTFPGPLTIRYALGGSRNVPALKAMAIVGTDKVVQTAKKLMQSPGSTQGEARGDYKCYSDEASTIETPCYTSSALGDGAYLRLDEHVHGYATLSRNGLNIPQTYILKIEDSAGKTIDEWKPSKGVQAVRPDTAYIIDDMLSDPRASYFTNKPHSYKGWKFGLKTGTTNDNKDALMMMMSTKYAAGVWVGYHNRTVAFKTDSGTLTVPIIVPFFQKVHDGLKPEERVRPSGVKTLPAYVIRGAGGMYGAQFPSPSTDLYPSWYTASNKATASKKTIDIVSNKLATDCTPARARKEITDTNANSFSGDKFVAGGDASNTTESDDIHRCDDNRPTISIVGTPSSSSMQVQISAGTHPLSSEQFPGTVSIVIDGQTVQSYSVTTSGTMTLNYNYSGSGSKDVQVVVVDSVLYDATDTASVTFSGSSSSLNLTGASVSGGNTKFTWTGGSGLVTIYRKLDNSVVCNGPGGTCSVPKSAALPGTAVYAKDSEGNVSGTVAVTP